MGNWSFFLIKLVYGRFLEEFSGSVSLSQRYQNIGANIKTNTKKKKNLKVKPLEKFLRSPITFL